MIKNETLLAEIADKYRIPVRIMNILFSQDVTTVGQLMDFVPNRQMRNLGKKSLCEILELQDELSRELEPKKDDKEINWEEVRIKAAIAALQGYASNPNKNMVEAYTRDLAEWSVLAADFLISELKEGGAQ